MLTHIPTNEGEAREALHILQVVRDPSDRRHCLDIVLKDYLPEFIHDYVEIPAYEIYEPRDPKPTSKPDPSPYFVKRTVL